MILPKDRDPRFITVRRGGTLKTPTISCSLCGQPTCAEHVLHLFEAVQPADARPRQAIEQARAWVRGEITMSQARTAGAMAKPLHGICPAQRGMRRMLPGRPRWWRMSPPTSSALRPTQSRRSLRLRLTARVNAPAGGNASGSANSCRKRSAILCWTISGCETTSAGRCSTADEPSACAGTTQQAPSPRREQVGQAHTVTAKLIDPGSCSQDRWVFIRTQSAEQALAFTKMPGI